MKRGMIIILMLCCTANAFAQIQWEKCYGPEGDATSIRQTFDLGYIIAGTGDPAGGHGHGDFWIVKTSQSGDIQWQKSYGGSSSDAAFAVVQATDSGYIIVGSTESSDGDVTGYRSDGDCWVIKISAAGAMQWQKCLGGGWSDFATAVQQTSDGGYIVAASSESPDGDVSGNHGGYDYWLAKLSPDGTLQWEKSYGGSSHDYCYSVQQTSDGGFVLAGSSESNDGDVTGNHGNANYWVVKVSSTGALEWQKSLGGNPGEEARSIIQTSDTGYIVVGYSYSNNGDVTGHHGSTGTDDFWVVKLSSTGSLQWERSLGGYSNDIANSVMETSSGMYVVAGGTYSNDGDVSGNHGNEDYWVVTLSPSGSILSQNCFGGSFQEGAQSIVQSSDGGLILAGSSNSNDGDVTGNNGYPNYWVVKLGDHTSINNLHNTSPISISPNPTTGAINITATGLLNIKIYNTLGQLIKEANNTNYISIAEYPVDLYFISLFNAAGLPVYHDKIIKL